MTKTELKKNWKEALDSLSSDSIKKTKVDAWFRPLTPYSLDDEQGILYLISDDDNSAVQTNLINKNISIILPAVEKYFGKSLKIVVKDSNDMESSTGKTTPEEKSLNDEYYEEFIIPRYSFDRFVCGSNNRLALAVSLAIAENYAEEYNPLFIYGGSGLGKTHLLHAITNYIRQNQPERKVLYVSSETFTNEYIDSVRKNNMDAFRKKYRNTDVLLIDDIQFIAGKKETSEELFHIFESLKNSGKQIVFSSDKPPKDLDDIPERLISRFSWGIIADIQPPDYETRVAILTQKAETDGFTVDKDFKEVIDAIAQNITSNIRELEGALTRVVAQSTLINERITKDLAKRVLTDLFNTAELEVTPALIKKKVASYFGIKISDIEGPKRTKNLTYPRQVAMYLMRNYTELSLPQIGDEFGGRDHTTVIHSIEKITEEINSSENLKNSVEKIKETLT